MSLELCIQSKLPFKEVSSQHSNAEARKIINENFKKLATIFQDCILNIQVEDISNLEIPDGEPGIEYNWYLEGDTWTLVPDVKYSMVKYILRSYDHVYVPEDFQYIVHQYLILDGGTIEVDGELVILYNLDLQTLDELVLNAGTFDYTSLNASGLDDTYISLGVSIPPNSSIVAMYLETEELFVSTGGNTLKYCRLYPEPDQYPASPQPLFQCTPKNISVGEIIWVDPRSVNSGVDIITISTPIHIGVELTLSNASDWTAGRVRVYIVYKEFAGF